MQGKYQAYSEYKESGSQWVDEIPTNWKVLSLKHILSIPITDGPHSTPTFLDEGVPFVSAEAVSGGYINFNKIRGYISEADDVLFSQKYRPQRNDVYMIKSGATTGITAIVETDERFNIWSPLAVMRCKNNYSPYFLLYYLRSESFQKSVQLSWTFGTQQNIGMGTLENLTVCLPSIEEQENIANFLGCETAKIDTLIEKQQRLVELLKEKRQAVISHAVTKGLNPKAPMRDSGVEWLGDVPEHWIVCRLKQIIKSGSSISYGIVQPGEPLDEGVPFVQTTNMSQGTFELDDLQKTTTEIARAYPRSTLVGGEVILGIRASIGAAYVVPEKFKGYNLSRGVARIIPNSRILSGYLVSYFGTGAVDRYWGLSKQGSTFSEVSIETVKELFLPVPPVEEQKLIYQWIEEKVSRINKIIDQAMEQTSLLKERRTALISAVVTGKIDVRNWQAPESSNTNSKEVAA